MEKPRCQSCGMPFTAPGFYGTNADGSENQEYCMFCLKRGAFTLDITLKGMIDRSVQFMHAKLGYPEDEARRISEAILPGLKRWQKSRR